MIVNQLSLSSYSSTDPSSLGSVVRGSSAGRSGHCCDYLLKVIGPSGLAPIWPYVNLLHWSFSPGPRRDDLTIYWALGPFVRSFIFLVDPGDICPPHKLLEHANFIHCSIHVLLNALMILIATICFLSLLQHLTKGT
jgi:hypothetical protein